MQDAFLLNGQFLLWGIFMTCQGHMLKKSKIATNDDKSEGRDRKVHYDRQSFSVRKCYCLIFYSIIYFLIAGFHRNLTVIGLVTNVFQVEVLKMSWNVFECGRRCINRFTVNLSLLNFYCLLGFYWISPSSGVLFTSPREEPTKLVFFHFPFKVNEK